MLVTKVPNPDGLHSDDDGNAAKVKTNSVLMDANSSAATSTKEKIPINKKHALHEHVHGLRASSMADHSPIALLSIDSQGVVITANKACKFIIGIPASVLIGSCLYDYLNGTSLTSLQRLLTDAQRGTVRGDITIDFAGSPVENTHLSVRVNAFENEVTGTQEFILSFADASRQKKIGKQLRKANEYLEKLVSQDALTGLPNRVHFIDALRAAMLNARKSRRKIALLFFDIDGFKRVNDRLGHRAGDALLCEIANRLKLRIRDIGRLARLGGDEFTLILDYPGCEQALRAEAQKVLNTIAGVSTIGSMKINITASIGIAIYPGYANTPEQLIHYADTAMYRAKACGGNETIVFCATHHEKIERANTLSHSIKSSIANSEFYLEFQPIVNSESHAIESFEVLTRWHHPEFGNVSPDEFIALAEKNNQIELLSRWIISSAIEKLGQLYQAGYEPRFAINISSLLISNEEFPPWLIAEMRRCKVPPNAIEFEITETEFINHLDNAIQFAKKLHECGCRIALDDFGTGYSSLARITELPIDTIKLDKLFIAELNSRKESRVIVEAIITIARELQLHVVAEGVEHELQCNLLRELGCQCLQGFIISRPVSEQGLESLLEAAFVQAAHEQGLDSAKSLVTC